MDKRANGERQKISMTSPKNILKIILFAGDIFFVYAASFLTLITRHGRIDFWTEIDVRFYLAPFSFIYIFWFLLLYIFDFYEIPSPESEPDRMRNLAAFMIGALIAGILYFYFRPGIGISPKTTLVFNVTYFGLML